MSASRQAARQPLPQAPFTAQDDFFDAIVRHQVFLQRFANGLTRQATDLLNNDETFFRTVIFERIRRITQAPSVANLSRTDRMIRQMIDRRQESWKAIRELWAGELRALMAAEVQFVDRSLKGAVPVQLTTNVPGKADTNKLLTQTRYQGRTLAGWLASLQVSDARIIQLTVSNAVGQGFGPIAASRALIGTRSASGRDGALQTTRNHVATIARSSVTGLTNVARQSYYVTNAELFEGTRFTAVLDGRTTPICQSTDGEQHPVGEGPQPPLHLNCRSVLVPILDGELIGRRNATPLFERRTLREFTDANGLAPVTKRADLPHGFKGKFDRFQQQRAIQVVGTEPLATTYEQWMARQPARFQDDVLGATRGKLFRDGGLSLDRFVDSADQQLTLNQLSKRDASAFRAAGLDPDNPKWANLERGGNPGGGSQR